MYLDCLHLKIRDDGVVRTKAVYLAIGVNLEGIKDVLGIWIAQTEGAKFWLGILTEIKNRGVQDVFIACVDGLKGFPEAIESVFPLFTGATLHCASRALQLEFRVVTPMRAMHDEGAKGGGE
jgi:putative transposase